LRAELEKLDLFRPLLRSLESRTYHIRDLGWRTGLCCTPSQVANNAMKKTSPNPIDVYVGSRIRMRRKMLGLSQENLAKSVKLTFQQIQKYEKGTNRVGASRLQQIASILQVPPSFFFEDVSPNGSNSIVPETPSPNYISEFVSTSDGLELIKAFTRIESRALRRSVVALVQQLNPDD
jgi:transcriptional regulator with XRE-family HTH domain